MMRVRLDACKTGLTPPPPEDFYITDRSNAIVLLWFLLFCGLSRFFMLFESSVRFQKCFFIIIIIIIIIYLFIFIIISSIIILF